MRRSRRHCRAARSPELQRSWGNYGVLLDSGISLTIYGALVLVLALVAYRGLRARAGRDV